MSKFETPNKMKLLRWAILPIAVVILSSVSEAKNSSLVAEGLQNAKTLLVQGQRLQAIEELDRLKTLTKNKSELAQILKKRELFFEQFIFSESFQNYENAKGMYLSERVQECLKELDGIKAVDQDNLLILRLRSQCQLKAQQIAGAQKTLKKILTYQPKDFDAQIASVEALVLEGKSAQAKTALDAFSPAASHEKERYSILKARLVETLENPTKAADFLRGEVESHRDHVEAMFELAALYARITGQEVLAQKYLSAFINRCKGMNLEDYRNRRLKLLLPRAQDLYEGIEKRLAT